ncbi:MAG: hypothetical protein ACLU5F_11525 [Anaerovoracaceae bacterium]
MNDNYRIGCRFESRCRVIRELNQRKGTTVILTTHDMQDIEALTNRIVLIGKGQILLDGSLSQIKEKYTDKNQLTVSYSGPAPSLCEGITLSSVQSGQMTLLVDAKILSVSQAIAYLSEHAEITDLSVSGSTTEEIVVQLYKEFRI